MGRKDEMQESKRRLLVVIKEMRLLSVGVLGLKKISSVTSGWWKVWRLRPMMERLVELPSLETRGC